MPLERLNLSRAFATRVQLALGPNREPPTSFPIFALGKNETENGDVIVDAEGMAEALAWAERWGNRIPINYNHFGRSKEDREKVVNPAEAFKAAGSFRLGARPDGLWAEDVRWTPTADRKIRDEEFLYTSPEVWLDTETKRLLIVDGCAITNSPATRNMKPLVASRDDDPPPNEPPAGGSPQQGETEMPLELKLLLSHALLPAETPEHVALATLGDNARASRGLLSKTGAKTLDEALGVIDGWKSAAGERDQLREQLSRGEGEAVGARMRLALETATKPDEKGRIRVTPAEKAWAETEYSLSDPKKPPTKADEARLTGYLSTKSFATAEAAQQSAPPPGQAPGTPPAAGTSGSDRTTHNGKAWSQLSIKELEALKTTDQALYDRLRSDHDKARKAHF